MDNLENLDNLESKAAGTPNEDVQEQVDSLRQTVFGLLVVCVIISGTFLIFLARQYRLVSNDLKAISPQANALIAEHTKQTGPAMQQFVTKLIDFSKTHPDFAPVLTKYGVSNPPAAPTSAAPTAPAKK